MEITPEGFQLLYESGPCLAVNKPGGLLTQAPPHIDSLEQRVKSYFKLRDEKPGRVYLGVPHRLDRPASGLLVMARHVRAARRLSEQFQHRMVEKTYWMLVEGVVPDEEGTWTDFMRKVPDQPLAELVERNHPDAKHAVLHFRRLAVKEDMSWLEVRLETGRMHQIRLQASTRAHPIVGDAQYGSAQIFGPQTEDLRQRWIALHAKQLSFRHPMNREPVSLQAPLPDFWPDWVR